MKTLFSALVCPVTRQTVSEVPLDIARRAVSGGRPLATRTHGRTPIGETATVMLRDDGCAAYPVVDGYPVLLGPEVLTSEPREFDLVHSHYAEAYLETAFYEAEASAKAQQIAAEGVDRSSSEMYRWLASIARLPAHDRAAFPHPRERWLSDRMDLGANWDCLEHIGAVRGRRVLQVGGTGGMLSLLLLAGATDGWLVTPMVSEARLASALAAALGVRIETVVGVAEELPIASDVVDVAFSGGCVHHMVTGLALPEIARVLRRGGRFAAAEPWRAPLYAIGTRVFGKREANAFCRPLTPERVASFPGAFSEARIVQHGAFTRYAMLAAEKLGARIPTDVAWRVGSWDDRLSTLLGLRRFGSSVALLGVK